MTDIRTRNAMILRGCMHATMNFDRDELERAGVIEVGNDAQWSKWNNDAPMYILKLTAVRLNALAALIEDKFDDVFPADAVVKTSEAETEMFQSSN